MTRNWSVAALTALILPLILAACATLNEDECKVTDWYTLGNSDGVNGFGQSYVSNHVEACSKFGIVPDQSAWNQGWQIGIRQHCTPINGLNRGKAGRLNPNTCPADLAVAYSEGHRLGRAVYDAQQELNRLQTSINSDISTLTSLTEAERVQKQLEIELKRNRLFTLQNNLNNAQRAADNFQFRQSTSTFVQ